MLDRLYSLYVTVITTIKGYGDYFWVDVVEKVDEMGEQVLGVAMQDLCRLAQGWALLLCWVQGCVQGVWQGRAQPGGAGVCQPSAKFPNKPSVTQPVPPAVPVAFGAGSNALPKALRDWQAYVDCRDTIDNFLEMLPLFQASNCLGCGCYGLAVVPRSRCLCTATRGVQPQGCLSEPSPRVMRARAPPEKTAFTLHSFTCVQALAHQAMRERHWRAVMAITGRELSLAEDVFKLQHLLDCGLLALR